MNGSLLAAGPSARGDAEDRDEVLVLGAGVIGLTVAVELLEAGQAVRVWCREMPEDTVSAVAAAIWYPYAVGPRHRVLGWARQSLKAFLALALHEETGVHLRKGVIVDASQPDPDQADDWLDLLAGRRAARASELPRPGVAGRVAKLPVVEMPRYLPYLVARLHRLGGRLERHEVGELGEALHQHRTVVNCTGLGAARLCDDPALEPVRGVVQRFGQGGEKDSRVKRFVIDDGNPDGLLYVVPRRDDVVVGGTNEPGETSLEPDPAEVSAIEARGRAAVPRLERLEPLGPRAGLRPGRPEVRLERERRDDGRCLVHCYGHGGAGVTLSWGCAREVRDLVGA